MKIKVCGLKYLDNIKDVLDLSVDFIGLIFYNKSLRYVNQSSSLEYIHKIKPEAKIVGVFVNSSFQDIMSIVNEYSLTAVQLHANESPELCSQLRKQNLFVIKAFSVDEEFNFSDTNKYSAVCDMFVFDTKTKLYGGSGHKFNWQILDKYTGDTTFLLSGGISAKDIDEVNNFSHGKFAGVDLNSAFETEPAKKNIIQLRGFISQIK